MDLNKYSKLRDEVINQDYETKNKDIDLWLNIFSYVGNIGSIFFAFFLVYPALLKAISANLLQGDISIFMSGFITIIILSGFELLKRKVLANLSFDLIKNKFKIKKSLIGWIICSIGFIVASFYFSLNGAKEFASTSKNKNVKIEINIDQQIDSLNLIYADYKKEYLNDNKKLRESNSELRDKISETPLNYRTVRRELQVNIDANLETINNNEIKINELEKEFTKKTSTLKNKLNKEIQENNNEDTSSIYLFLIISTSIEFLIIMGVFFRKNYEFKVYLSKRSELEEIIKKRDRYRTLIKFIYKEGMVSSDQQIMGKTKLLDLLKEKSTLSNPTKFLDGFFNDMEYLGIIRLGGKRRYTAVSYQEAISKINKFDDTIRLIENLK